ncbi:transposase [Rickettsia endosymbiont of Ixodes scapularis]|uniref:transposase n=2 Tax=spotted fever group TaxID=114277 RepID=UPI0001A60852|nr:transposase [Rickettsia endosymbiont of Ixodes scapularis]EER21934.1 transposase [Rickettsia endosymbiont of Ixodes scapularis]
MLDKILLLKRALIESVFSKIKLLGKFEHSRHRSVTNAFVHMVAALINYQMSDNKPSITYSRIIDINKLEPKENIDKFNKLVNQDMQAFSAIQENLEEMKEQGIA